MGILNAKRLSVPIYGCYFRWSVVRGPWMRFVRTIPPILGLFLLFAAVSKSVDPVTLAYAIEQVFGWDRVLTWRVVLAVAMLEAIIGSALIFSIAPRALSLVVGVALIGMTAFLIQLSGIVFRDHRDDRLCGIIVAVQPVG